jgi:hypothetical protein
MVFSSLTKRIPQTKETKNQILNNIVKYFKFFFQYFFSLFVDIFINFKNSQQYKKIFFYFYSLDHSIINSFDSGHTFSILACDFIILYSCYFICCCWFWWWLQLSRYFSVNRNRFYPDTSNRIALQYRCSFK